jgi:predicted NBD/HSP70 family sugar kinase
MQGCLAAVASGRAVAAELRSLGFEAASGRDVRALLQAGEPDAARLTRAAGKRIGEVLATVVCLLNPEVVLVGGALASAPLLAGMRETLYRIALPRATRHMALHLGSLGEDAAVAGLTRLVVDREFSPDTGQCAASRLAVRKAPPSVQPSGARRVSGIQREVVIPGPVRFDTQRLADVGAATSSCSRCASSAAPSRQLGSSSSGGSGWPKRAPQPGTELVDRGHRGNLLLGVRCRVDGAGWSVIQQGMP